jgi:hypothetical protein
MMEKKNNSFFIQKALYNVHVVQKTMFVSRPKHMHTLFIISVGVTSTIIIGK